MGTGDSKSQLGHSCHSGFAGLGGDTVSNLQSEICGTSAACQAPWHCGLETSRSHEQHELCFLVALLTYLGHQALALESSACPIVNASQFLPVALNFDVSV